MPQSILHRCLSLASLFLISCSGGGGGGGDSPVAAKVPVGAGQTAIAMIGTWEIRDVTLVETNDLTTQLPTAGTRVVLTTGGVASIGGFPTTRTDLEAFLGHPLDFYNNQLDGRTVLYGLSYDRLASGGSREIVGLAGGSTNADAIAVEQYTEKQANSTTPSLYARFRYTLVRVASSLELPPFLLPNEARGPVVVDAVLRGGVSRAPATTVDAK